MSATVQAKVKERPILFSEPPPHVSRPSRWKGGRDAAQRRYRIIHGDRRNAQKREHYAANKESIRAQQSDYRKNNPDTVNASNRAWRASFWPALRREMIQAYGAACACCGENEPGFLQLDHIYNDGAESRRKYQNGRQEVLALKRSSWPQDRHQLLCANCNFGKALNGGICPHKSK